MIKVILVILCITMICTSSFILGAVAFAFGAYEKIKDIEGAERAKAFLAFMNKRGN